MLITSFLLFIEIIYPEQNLFLWSLLMNRFEIALIFWQIGDVRIIIEINKKLIKNKDRKLIYLASNMQCFICLKIVKINVETT